MFSKYHAKKTEVNGLRFDSKKEADRYIELKMLESVGAIKGLSCQVPFELIPQQKKDGKVVERAVKYFADFVYTDNETGETVVEDVKGKRLPEYIIKRKLMLHKYGIEIKEV